MIDRERVSIYEKYRTLQQLDCRDNGYNVNNISNSFSHKLGCSQSGFPMFFIECKGPEKIADIKLDIFSALFNRKCQIVDIDSDNTCFNTYSIIQLNSSNTELVRYFLDVIFLILRKIPAKPSVSQLRSELLKVIRLFSNPVPFSKDIVRGLWAELLIIEQAANPEYLIESWHVSPEDKFDFNDGENKIEVKSTSKSIRTHVFSLEQLNPNHNSQLLIGSVFVVQSGKGSSIFELQSKIESKISDTDCLLKLNEIILHTIGANISVVENMFFDYPLGVESLLFFDAKDVPSIPISCVPTQVSNIHFTSDLTSCKPFANSTSDNKLFKSL